MTNETGAGHRPIQPLKTVQAAAQTTNPDPGYYSEIYVPSAAAGVRVTQQTALTFAAVFAAIRAISEDIAGLGHKTRRQEEDGKRKNLIDHPASRVIAYPNPEITGYTLRETMQAHALSWGNGYAEIERNARNRPVALWLITPDRVTPRRIDGRIWYQVRNSAGKDDTYLPAENMLHLHGLGFDGLGGYSVVNLAARTIGMGIAGDEYGASTYNNRATPSGVLKHPKTLDPDGRANLRTSWENLYRGSKNANRVAILEEGMDFTAIGMPPEDVQYLENRSFQIEEIARWYRIPPHKLAHIVKSTFNNIEEQNINYVQDALLPWTNRWEGECDRKLLSPGERGTTKNKFNLNTLLRGAQEKRYESYVKGRQWGWLSPNDVRSYEDQDPLPPEIGDSYITPMNMTPTELLGREPETPPETNQEKIQETDDDQEREDNSERMAAAYLRPVIYDAIYRCINREVQHARRAPERIKLAAEFVGWSAHFYAKQAEYCTGMLKPAVDAAMLGAIGRIPDAAVTVLNGFVQDFNQDTKEAIYGCWELGTIGEFDLDEAARIQSENLSSRIADLISLSDQGRTT